MTLVIDRYFETLRDAIQGCNCVGRFGDACKRVRFNDVKLIDKESPFIHKCMLQRSLIQLEKKSEPKTTDMARERAILLQKSFQTIKQEN